MNSGLPSSTPTYYVTCVLLIWLELVLIELKEIKQNQTQIIILIYLSFNIQVFIIRIASSVFLIFTLLDCHQGIFQLSVSTYLDHLS